MHFRSAGRRANDPLFGRWLEQITTTGGCAHPIHLTGSTTVYDAATGIVLHHDDTSAEPGERLLVRCRNRRATVCPACSRLHAGDTYDLVRAGLLGGKNIPIGVRDRPDCSPPSRPSPSGPYTTTLVANAAAPDAPGPSANTDSHSGARPSTPKPIGS
ncbi:replication initiator [Streptomyces sp. NPDC048639]|uniref:replication initiator n=1 Tax=Streptomyces sp. NPDC048639 TaxID=3365581 RepID=UPI0037217F9B